MHWEYCRMVFEENDANKKGRHPAGCLPLPLWSRVVLFLEVAVVESNEAGSVAGLVLGHLVDGVVESV